MRQLESEQTEVYVLRRRRLSLTRLNKSKAMEKEFKSLIHLTFDVILFLNKLFSYMQSN